MCHSMTAIKKPPSAYLCNVLYKETCKFTFHCHISSWLQAHCHKYDIIWRFNIMAWKKIKSIGTVIYIIVMENICFEKYLCINWSFSHWKRDARKKKKANQETMININWKTLFCAIQRHIRRTVYQPHEP